MLHTGDTVIFTLQNKKYRYIIHKVGQYFYLRYMGTNNLELWNNLEITSPHSFCSIWLGSIDNFPKHKTLKRLLITIEKLEQACKVRTQHCLYRGVQLT